MANTKQIQSLAITLYGTQDLTKLNTKQTALIKAIIKDKTNKQNARLTRQT